MTAMRRRKFSPPMPMKRTKPGKGVVMRCVGPQTRGKECVLAGADVMIHTGEIGDQMNRDPEKWKDYVGLPPDAYCDMDPAKEKDMIAFLVAHNTRAGAGSHGGRPRFPVELEAHSAGRPRRFHRSESARLLSGILRSRTCGTMSDRPRSI